MSSAYGTTNALREGSVENITQEQISETVNCYQIWQLQVHEDLEFITAVKF